MQKLETAADEAVTTLRLQPLFQNQEEYDAFTARHNQAMIPMKNLADYSGDAYIGIDCGSTTTKLVVVGENNDILYSYYNSNQGNPVEIVRKQLKMCIRDRSFLPYEVQEGDTLISICDLRLLDYESYRQIICAVNGIENPNYIMPGQTILLPVFYEADNTSED